MKNFFFLLTLLLSLVGTANAQYWQSLNPGAGGRVQGLSCDPTVPGRMFMASDMEGFYYTSDYGTSWQWAAKNLPTAFILVAKGHGDTFYVGHAKGLSISPDKGASYTHPSVMADKTIGVITVDAQQPDHIFAGINWRGNDGHLRHYPQETTDVKQLFYSTDGGQNWHKSSWDAYASGDPRVQSITVHPNHSSQIFISTADGLFKSTNTASSWSLVSAPAGLDGAACWGADISADGKWLFALYRKGGFARLFVQDLANGQWQDLGKGSWDSHQMWEPLVYQDSQNDTYHVLVSQRDQNPNEGLFEATVDLSSHASASAVFQVVMSHNGNNSSVPYDIGWNYYVANCRNKTYFPAAWNLPEVERGVFTQAQQSYFTGDAAKGNEGWRVVSTGYVKTENGLDFYRSRGTASTFTYDMAGHGNYLIQGQADNLALESWDNGGSWVQSRTTFGVQDGHGVHIIPTDPAIVLMDAASGYGGGNPAANSNLLYKTLDLDQPNHNWQKLAFGTSAADKKGLPKNRIWQFHADPEDYKRLYVITHTGLYLCDDIVSLINTGAPYFRKIHSGTSLGADFAFDTENTDKVYYKDNSGTYKGSRNSDGSYSWQQMSRSTGQTNNMHWGGLAVVNRDGHRYTYTYERYKGIVLAKDEATTFEASAVLWDADLFNYLEQPDWYDPSHHIIQTNDMLADGHTLYVTYQIWEDVRWGYGVMKGIVQADGSVQWSSWTDDLHYSTTKKMKLINGKLYLATQGAGLLARKINGQTADPLPPIDEGGLQPPVNIIYNIYTDAATTAGLAWGSFGNVESSASTAQAAEGSASRYVQGLDQSVAPGADHALTISFDPLKATGGTLELSGYGIGGSMNGLNVKLQSADGGNINHTNKSFPANQWGTVSVPLSGGSFDASQFSQITIERWGGGASKAYIDKILISGVEVSPGNPSTVPVTGVQISTAPLRLALEEEQLLDFAVLPANATNQAVIFSSQNEAVATVSSEGLVRASGLGNTTITVTTADGGFTDVIDVEAYVNTNGDCDAVSGGDKPNPPCQVWAQVTSESSVVLHWQDNSDNEAFFEVQAQEEGDSFRGANMPKPAADNEAVSISGLNIGRKYTFRIKAKNSAGASIWVESSQVELMENLRLMNDAFKEKGKVYPNPASGLLTITHRKGERLHIIDATGRPLKMIDISSSLQTIDVSDLPRGHYFIGNSRQWSALILQ
ncbi:Ig-like domain-containing protein [Persicobacter psychrovividus]|uniref:Fibronectin type-III domain-containing protein n=1 Tax=Persicobacter psychrovividus TaxID=387638 RepID=A0ABM7VIH6_9BACT|nr:hypothetical protein PEPS_30620 [Persicobacter psychrovividus]